MLVVVALLSLRGAESRRARIQQGGSLEYKAISCRSHSASLKDFGGVADGKTSNTKAFQAAIAKLSQYASDGGAQLYIPAGKWLTGSFSLTSHFTLYLDKDAVLLASQVLFLGLYALYVCAGVCVSIRWLGLGWIFLTQGWKNLLIRPWLMF